MNPIPALTPHLKQLRLSGILDSLEARNRQAIESKLAYTEFLALLIEDEVARREQKKFASRLRRAAFRTNKTLDQFEFAISTNALPFSSWDPAAPAKAISLRHWATAPCAKVWTSPSAPARSWWRP